MLDAFVSKGVRHILPMRGTERVRNQNEDAITSMVFTPLRFMSARDSLICLKMILPSLDARVAERSILSTSIELWPAKLRDSRGRRVEPDLRAELQFSDGSSLIVIGEMKWESLITREQIQRETECAVQQDCYVFAIVKNKSDLTADKLGCSFLSSWKEVHSRLACHLGYDETSAPSIWAALVSKFLNKAEQLVFTGFSADDLALAFADQKTIFFRGRQSLRVFDFGDIFLPAPKTNHVFFRRKQ
jgi:hypothetical protein